MPEEDEENQEEIFLKTIRKYTMYDGQFKADATRWIREAVDDITDPRLTVTTQQTYAAAAYAEKRLASVAFTGDDEQTHIFSEASKYHWKVYIRDVSTTHGTSSRQWKRITRSRIRSQQHQLTLIRNNAAKRLFFWAGQIPYDPSYEAHPHKKRRTYSKNEREAKARRQRMES